MFKKQHVASVPDVPDFVHIRAPHTFAIFRIPGVFRLPLGSVRLCPILCPVPTQMELD